MVIGIPGVVEPQQHRIAATAGAMRNRLPRGHEVLGQAGRGAGSGFGGEAFHDVRPTIGRSARAARTALGLGASATSLDIRHARLRYLDAAFLRRLQARASTPANGVGALARGLGRRARPTPQRPPSATRRNHATIAKGGEG